MNCIYCGNDVGSRTKGDHIIPQALGIFYPNVGIKQVCAGCDNLHGRSFEKIALRSGFIGFFRKALSIKNQNSKRAKRPPNNPTLDKTHDIESQAFHVESESNPKVKIYLGDDGYIHSSDMISVQKFGEVIDEIYITPTRSIRNICEFIQSKALPIDGITYKLYISESYADVVLKELKSRGVEIDDRGREENNATDFRVTIYGLFTENTIRLVCNILIKAMVHIGYSDVLLGPLIKYVHTGEHPSLFYIIRDRRNSGFSDMKRENLERFYHSIDWDIREDRILVKVKMLSTDEKPGFCVTIISSVGNDDMIVVPYGEIVAKYDSTGLNGKLLLRKGDSIVCGV